MSILNSKQFGASLNYVKKATGVVQAQVQELLITGAYYCFKDGDPGQLNRILDVARESKIIRLEAVTAWVELVAGCARIKNERFVLNKSARDAAGITDEEHFAPFEADMRKVLWHEFVKPDKATSVFEADAYVRNVVKKLVKEGYADLAEAIRKAELEWSVTKARAEGTAAAQPEKVEA